MARKKRDQGETSASAASTLNDGPKNFVDSDGATCKNIILQEVKQKKKGISEFAGTNREATFSPSNLNGCVEMDGVTPNDNVDPYPLPDVGLPSKIERSDINTSGMTACQKKNLKKKLRKQDQKREENECTGFSRNGSPQTLSDRFLDLEKRWCSRVELLESRNDNSSLEEGTLSLTDLVKAFIEEMQETHEVEAAQLKKPVKKRVSVDLMQENIKEIEQTLQKQQKDLHRITHHNSSRNVNGGGGEKEWDLEAKVTESLRYLSFMKEQLILTEQQQAVFKLAEQIKVFRGRLEAVLKRELLRKQQNGGDIEGRKLRAKEEVWKRRLIALGATPLETSFFNIVYELSQEGFSSLFVSAGQPVMVLRKLERRFMVLIERQSGSRINVIGYDSASVYECIKFLSECVFPQIPGGYEVCENCINMEGRNIGAFVGSGGTNLKKLEDELKVFLQINNNWLCVLGFSADVEIAVGKIKENFQKMHENERKPTFDIDCAFPNEIARAMANGGLKVRELIEAVERETGASINTRFRRLANSSNSVIFIQGGSVAICQRAKLVLEEQFRAFIWECVPCDKELFRLLKGSPPNFYPNNLDAVLVTALRGDGGLLLVGPPAAVKEAIVAATAAIQQMKRITSTVNMKLSQAKLFSLSKRLEIEAASGANCRPPVLTPDVATLIFTGTLESVEMAISLVHEFIKNQGEEEEIALTVDLLMQLLLNKGQRVQELENKLSVKIKVDRSRSVLSVVGAAPQIENFKTALKDIENEITTSGMVTKVVPILKDMASLVIGRGGATVRKIQDDCALDWVHVDNANGRVSFRGTESAICKAEEMLQGILKNDFLRFEKRNMIDGGADFGSERNNNQVHSSSMRRGGAGRGRGGAFAKVQRPAVTEQQWEMDAADETVFPALDACTQKISCGKWKKGGIKKKVLSSVNNAPDSDTFACEVNEAN